MDLNSVTISGRLTKDPDIRYTQSGFQITTLSLANNQRKKEASGQWTDKASYFTVKVLGSNMEKTLNALKKGNQIGVTGRLENSEWEQDGLKKYRTEIICQNLHSFDRLDYTSSESDFAPMSATPSDDDIPF